MSLLLLLGCFVHLTTSSVFIRTPRTTLRTTHPQPTTPNLHHPLQHSLHISPHLRLLYLWSKVDIESGTIKASEFAVTHGTDTTISKTQLHLSINLKVSSFIGSDGLYLSFSFVCFLDSLLVFGRLYFTPFVGFFFFFLVKLSIFGS